MAGTIMPCPKFTGLDNNGDPLSGGKLYTYAAGTTTPQDTYSDVGLSVANTNPIILDSGGRATVFLSNSSYKFVLKDSADVTIWTQDNISAFNPTNLDIEGTVGEAVTAGQLVYLSDGSGGKTAGKWYLADADFDYASSLPTIAVVTVSAAINASASLRMQGSYTYGSALVAGSSYYVSGTAGALATTPGTYSRFVGICEVDGFTLVFSPNPPNIALSPTFATVTATQAFVLGSATTNGIRMDLNSGTMEIREGDDSAYGPLNVGTTQVSGDLKPLANDGGSLGVSGTAWSDAYLASGGIIDWNAGDTTLTHSAGKLTISGSGAGALDIKGTTAPVSNDGAALGVSGRAWSDAYFASGGVIDWNAGDTTLTQSAGKLTLAGSGAGALDVKGTISPTANDGGSLGVSGTAWADLFLASGGVIDWNAGNTTLTQSAGKLTVGGSGAGDFGIGGTALIGTASTAMYESNAGSDLAANYHLKYTGGGSVTTGGVALTNTATTGMVGFWAENSGGKPIRGAAVEGSFTSVTAGAERSELVFYTQNLGTTAAKMRLTRAGELQPNTNDGATLGASGTAWADLYLASGGVINWDAGNTTLTHSAGKLTISGSGAGALDVKGTLSPTANDGSALGSGSVSWSDLFLASGGVINFANGDVTITHSSNTLTLAGASSGYVFNDGPVGIGVTPSAWDSSWKALQLGTLSAIAFNGSGNTTDVWTNTYVASGGTPTYLTTAAASFFRLDGGAFSWFNAPSGTAGTSATFTQRMTLTSAGSLLVGTSDAAVTTGVGIKSIASATIPQFAIVNNDATGGTTPLTLYNTNATNNGYRFYVKLDGGVANYSASNVNLSDARVKTDIKPLASMWDTFKALEIVTFKYRDQDHDDDNIGVIAQQVEAVAPEFVDVDGFGETPADGVPLKTIYTTDLYHAAIKALQEAMARIEALEARLN